jgi:capsular polysaccharide biosynthesis protein
VDPYRERIEDFMRRYGQVLVITVVLVAVAVASASYLQTPTYEASAQVWVDWEQEGPWKTLEYRELPTQTMALAIDSRPVAEKAVERLGLQREPVGRLGPMGAAELLDNLTVEQVEGTSFIVLTYEDTSPGRAQRIVNTVGEVSSESISESSSNLRATVFEKAALPESPVSPLPGRNGLVTLAIGLMFCAGFALAMPRPLAARIAGALGERPSRQGVGQTGVPGTWYSDHSIVERVNEKKLLKAIGRRGKLTAVEASLESELPVEEANRILEELAFAGQLEVTVEDGKLLYSFWGEHGA